MSELLFDEAGARKVEAIYLTPDVVAQRERVLTAAALRPAERVVDLGCGPGLLALEMLNRIGDDGFLDGIDASHSMIALAERRCAAWANARFQAGDVAALPYDDAAFDVGVCTQVYEYVQDVGQALRELRRVLRTGGRALIMDTDWESCVWHSSDPARMRAVIDAWDSHCAHPHLIALLPRLLRDAGLMLERVEVVPLLNLGWDEQTYSAGMIGVLARHAARTVGDDVALSWAADLRAMGAHGDYFFSLNRYLFCLQG
jgi:SAM-dependent methyltransferase